MSDLEQYRQEIDELDEQLVRLFLRRMEVTGKVGEYKLAHGMQVLDRERERRVLAKRASLAVDIRQEEDVKELFQTIMAISRRRQQELIDRSGTGTVRKTNVVLIGMPGSGKSCVGGGPGGAAGDAPGGDGRHGGGKDGALHPGHFCPGRGRPPSAGRRPPPPAGPRPWRGRSSPPAAGSSSGRRIWRSSAPPAPSISWTGTPGTSPTRSWTAGPCSAGAGPGIPVV